MYKRLSYFTLMQIDNFFLPYLVFFHGLGTQTKLKFYCRILCVIKERFLYQSTSVSTAVFSSVFTVGHTQIFVCSRDGAKCFFYEVCEY